MTTSAFQIIPPKALSYQPPAMNLLNLIQPWNFTLNLNQLNPYLNRPGSPPEPKSFTPKLLSVSFKFYFYFKCGCSIKFNIFLKLTDLHISRYRPRYYPPSPLQVPPSLTWPSPPAPNSPSRPLCPSPRPTWVSSSDLPPRSWVCWDNRLLLWTSCVYRNILLTLTYR